MDLSQIIAIGKPIIEILILWLIIYNLLLFFRGTRMVYVIRGIIILLGLFILFQKLQFEVLSWLLTKLFGLLIIVIVFIFHSEIKQGLARLGKGRFFSSALKAEELDFMLKQISKSVEILSKNKIGALIVIEKSDSLNPYIDSGVRIDAKISSELIETIFAPNTVLHDGGMIIQQGRVSAAGCIFPLSENNDLSRIFGTRHRAALGLSEEVDAVILVISEERQDISLIFQGEMRRDMSREELFAKIKDILTQETQISSKHNV